VKLYGQDIDKLTTHPWVDSVYATLSADDKMNQLLVLKFDENDQAPMGLPSSLGGALIMAKAPEAFQRKVAKIQSEQKIPTLIIAGLHEDGYGIAVDSMIEFGSAITLASIAEPYLLYETGSALGIQSRWLGIDVLTSPSNDLLHKNTYRNEWRLLEINQGLIDQKVLPLNYVQLTDFTSIEVSDIINANVMISIDGDEIEQFHQFVRKSIAERKISRAAVEYKCRQVLAMKLFADQSNAATESGELQKTKIESISKSHRHNLLAQSLTVLKNESNLLPIMHLDGLTVASLTVGHAGAPVLETYLDKYMEMAHFQIDYEASDTDFANLWTELNTYDVIICGLYESEFLRLGIDGTDGFSIFQDWINKSGKGITAFFGDPSLLSKNRTILDNDTFVLAYENIEANSALVAQLIFGGAGAYGKLPVNIGYRILKDEGVQLDPIGRFGYAPPENGGLNRIKLQKIDSIARSAIAEGAMPGCQILVAKDNNIIYQKSFGYHTYDSVRLVNNHDLYDLASITKVSGALPALMKLYEEGRFDLEATMGTYLPYFKKGNKKKLTYREILAHQSGLTPYIVYWQTAMKKSGRFKRKTLSNEKSESYQYEIGPNLYLHNSYKEKIYKQIKKSKLGDKTYSYSGLTFLLYPEIIEAITGQHYRSYIDQNFYGPLGASSLTYKPLEKYALDDIVPTEYDSLFRKSLVHGTVHDEAAAMMQGVSSNAGLFANANDLAKLFQMYCNYGTFGSKEYLNEETLLEFTRCQYPENDNRRGLGFDRPLPEPHDDGNTARSVSQNSFGHSGFTGTFAWADPEYNLVYIFLSNRVHTTRKNTKLYRLNVRTNIQQAVYEAMDIEE